MINQSFCQTTKRLIRKAACLLGLCKFRMSVKSSQGWFDKLPFCLLKFWKSECRSKHHKGGLTKLQFYVLRLWRIRASVKPPTWWFGKTTTSFVKDMMNRSVGRTILKAAWCNNWEVVHESCAISECRSKHQKGDLTKLTFCLLKLWKLKVSVETPKWLLDKPTIL